MFKKTLIVLGVASISAYSSSVIAEDSMGSELACGATPELGCLEENVVKCSHGCFEDKVYLQQGET
ncbi:MAG: hypothetical protein ABFS56_16900, partial [Pseudomonadota bacterium]